MKKRTFNIFFVALLIGSIILSACAAPAAEAPAEEAMEEEPVEVAEVDTPDEFDWKQVEGTKLTVFLSETPMAVGIRSHIDEFIELTGIDLEYLVVTEDQYWNKLTIDLASGSNQFQVFMSGPSINWGYANAGQIQPLDPYIADETLTPANWDVDDFYPWAFESNRWDGTPGPKGLGAGDLWGVPIDAVLPLFTFRKDIFDKYELEVPETWEDWAAVAAEIQELTGGVNEDGTPLYPVVQRGALNTTTLSGPFMSGVVAYGGSDFHDDLTSAVNDPEAVAFQELYMDTIKDYGTPEWPNQIWFDVQQGFSTGQYAMVMDVGDFIPVYEKEGGPVAGKLGYTRPLAGPEGRASSLWTWGFSMNAATEGDQAKAAWLFIMWASNQEVMKSFAKTGAWPTRLSVWESDEVQEFAGQFGEGEYSFVKAFGDTMANDVGWYVSPSIVSGGAGEFWVKGLHDYYFGDEDMQTVMDRVASEVNAFLVESGVLEE